MFGQEVKLLSASALRGGRWSQGSPCCWGWDGDLTKCGLGTQRGGCSPHQRPPSPPPLPSSPSPQQPVQDWGKEVPRLPQLYTNLVPLCPQHVPFMCSPTARCKAPNSVALLVPESPPALGKVGVGSPSPLPPCSSQPQPSVGWLRGGWPSVTTQIAHVPQAQL